MAEYRNGRLVTRPITSKDEKAIIKAGSKHLAELQRLGYPMRSKRDQNDIRLAIRGVLMDEMNYRGIKWWGKENNGLVDRLTDNVISNSKSVSLRSNVVRLTTAARGNSNG